MKVLKNIEPQAHSTKKVFVRHGITNFTVSRLIGKTDGHTYKILAGLCKPTPDVERLLSQAAQSLDK